MCEALCLVLKTLCILVPQQSRRLALSPPTLYMRQRPREREWLAQGHMTGTIPAGGWGQAVGPPAGSPTRCQGGGGVGCRSQNISPRLCN